MKSKMLLALGLSTGLSSLCQAAALPQIPVDCDKDIALKSYCTSFETSGVISGDVTVKLFAVVNRSEFPDYVAAFEQYVAFSQWPGYAEASGRTDVIFNTSVAVDSLIAEDGTELLRHYADYRLNSVIGYQNVRVVTHNYVVDPYEGALGSIEFAAQTSGAQPVPEGADPLNGSIGVQSQIGSVHAVDCNFSELCGEDQMLLVYETTVRPDIDLLPQLAGRAISNGIESLLIGMFLMDDQSSDDDVL